MPSRAQTIPLEQFFAERDPRSRELFEVVREAVESFPEVQMRVTKSQVAWWRQHPFAWVWAPEQYLAGRGDLAPLVLTVGLLRRDASPRWKQIVEPRPGHFTHHLELSSAEQIDAEVVSWLWEAWELSG